MRMISNVSQTEWTFVSTVPTTQEMQEYLQSTWISRVCHTQLEEPNFTVRYVGVLSSLKHPPLVRTAESKLGTKDTQKRN